MPLVIPDRQKKALIRLIRLPSGQRAELLSRLREVPPALTAHELGAELAGKVGLSARELSDYMTVLISLYLTRSRHEIGMDKFVADVMDAARPLLASEKKSPEVDVDGFVIFLKEVLSLDASLGVTSKALDVMRQHERVFDEARILTDVRFVFRPDAAEDPAAALIIHALKLSFEENGEERSFFVALDSGDVAALRRTVERASRKEDRIKTSLQSTGIPILEAASWKQ